MKNYKWPFCQVSNQTIVFIWPYFKTCQMQMSFTSQVNTEK